MSNQSQRAQNQPDRSGQSNQVPLPPPKQPVIQPSTSFTVAHFTARELETLRKACRDSDYEHLWRDFVQPAIARAELPK